LGRNHSSKSFVGFTLIELLIAIAIIGILASSAFFVINPAGQIAKSHDAQRKHDLEQIRQALDTYYSDNNHYPDGTGGIIDGKAWGNSWSPYMSKIPKDPLSPDHDYLYESPVDGDTEAYRLYAKLERCSDSQTAVGVDCLRPYNYSINSSNLAMLAPIPTPTPTLIPTSTPTPTLTPTPTPLPKKIFVTSQQYNGNLGGLTGADAKCQTLAGAVTLGGTWKAWLSTDLTSAGSRISHHNGRYELVSGILIANNWIDLTDGTLVNAINANESGGIVSNDGNPCGTTQQAWTNTKSSGDSYYTNFPSFRICNNWTGGTKGTIGKINSLDSNWTGSCELSCSSLARLYCFEQ